MQTGHPALKEHLRIVNDCPHKMFAHPTTTACHMFDASDVSTQRAVEEFTVSIATQQYNSPHNGHTVLKTTSNNNKQRLIWHSYSNITPVHIVFITQCLKTI